MHCVSTSTLSGLPFYYNLHAYPLIALEEHPLIVLEEHCMLNWLRPGVLQGRRN
ncbi:hypothetical protein Barb7_01556 [Bacteroidales bacterium Barb7]|nr:hypothetical protein Barb7_01556 [Bacteroidales bacterium Barb7]